MEHRVEGTLRIWAEPLMEKLKQGSARSPVSNIVYWTSRRQPNLRSDRRRDSPGHSVTPSNPPDARYATKTRVRAAWASEVVLVHGQRHLVIIMSRIVSQLPC